MSTIAIRLTEAEDLLLKKLSIGSSSKSAWLRKMLLLSAYSAGFLTRLQYDKIHARQRFCVVERGSPRAEAIRQAIEVASTISVTTTGRKRGRKGYVPPTLFDGVCDESV